MIDSYDLSKLDPNAFENLVNALALRVLGSGHTGFGPGSDGGRDGYFQGEAIYPSEAEHWSGRWYIQSKFHKPNLSTDAQKWLLQQIREEISEFKKPGTKRVWPDIWIIATNIDPSGTPETGAFDAARAIVAEARPGLEERFHIWGGNKILALLSVNPHLVDLYSHFLTPGNVIASLIDQIKGDRANINQILRFLLIQQFTDQQYTKLEQAGSKADSRPGVHRLFVDLPFRCKSHDVSGYALECLSRTSAMPHSADAFESESGDWKKWNQHPYRSRVWFIKGGPGQGKSTIGQYFCQIHRAALILRGVVSPVLPDMRQIAEDVKDYAASNDLWPEAPRLPINIELKNYAKWLGDKKESESRGILTYLTDWIGADVEQPVHVTTLKDILSKHSSFIVFDGLDEVPYDVKETVATQVCKFTNEVLVSEKADALVVCTSRPQGYSGQFDAINGPMIEMVPLPPDVALRCAEPVIRIERSLSEANTAIEMLKSALQTAAVQEIMTTPLQAHIMAVVVRNGSTPPERKWKLYTNFYDVIKEREANRNLPDKKIARLLRENSLLLKGVHNRLGFVLHARAENSTGAQTSLQKSEFLDLLRDVVEQLEDGDTAAIVEVLQRATKDRLVLVNTPDDGDHYRFDIRPLQEFFAAEFLYSSVSTHQLHNRIELLVGDSHWQEVMHFLLSALVDTERQTEALAAASALSLLNDGNGDTTNSLLNRRMALGARLAARLIEDGVLSEDKRLRQSFAPALDPVGAMIDGETIDHLANVTDDRSRDWLINYLFSQLEKKVESENVGAANILARLLTDMDPATNKLLHYLKNVTPEYLGCILYEFVDSRFYVINTPEDAPDIFQENKWMVKLALTTLMSVGWADMGPQGVRAALSIIRMGIGTLEHVLPAILPDEQLQKWLIYIVNTKDGNYEETVSENLQLITFPAPDENDVADSRLSPDLQNHLSGFFKIAFDTHLFAATRKTKYLIPLLDVFGEQSFDWFEFLPSTITACLPFSFCDPIPQIVEQIKIRRDAEDLLTIGEYIGPFCIKRPINRMLVDDVYTEEEWRHVVDNFPLVAAVLWSSPNFINRQHHRLLMRSSILDPCTFWDRAAALNILIDTYVKQNYLFTYFPHFWGEWLDNAPQRSDEIRRCLVEACKDTNISHLSMSTAWIPLRLDLPNEACLLEYIIYSFRYRTHFWWPFLAGRQCEAAARVLWCLPQTSEALMSDNLTRYCAIREALFEHFPSRPAGNFARHLLTLAALISGIVGSRKCSLSAIASKVPSGGSPKGGGRESRVKRFSRWVENDRIDASSYYLPFVRALLEGLPDGPLVLVMDGSLVGRGCQALVISVLYEHQGRRRALPLVWSVVTGGKGHLSEQIHQDLVRLVIPLVPEGRQVVFLGDGEYNGVGLLGLVSQQGWKFACRIGSNTALCEDDEWFSLSFLPVRPGDGVELSDVLFTGHGFGPVLVTAQWRQGDDGPLYLVSNFDFFHEAATWYKKRFLIETLFADQKSRGFYLCHSHLSDPMRLSRLMIATCLAYLWMVCLGAQVHHRGWQGAVHRRDRCDLSLFQIGLVWLDHCLNEGLPLLVPLKPPKQTGANCVR